MSHATYTKVATPNHQVLLKRIFSVTQAHNVTSGQGFSSWLQTQLCVRHNYPYAIRELKTQNAVIELLSQNKLVL